MKFRRLRLTGFKSFVEPAEIEIEHGLTGVVGPNGCGKSNLLEALRWVMGESSHKTCAPRAWTMSSSPAPPPAPPATIAEVTLTLDNAAAAAPAGFNDADAIEVARRIDREAARPTASMAARPAPATFSCSSPMPRPAPARRPSCGRARSASSSTPAAGPPPHPRGGRRHLRALHPPPRCRAEAQGRRGQSRPARRRRRPAHPAARRASSGKPATR